MKKKFLKPVFSAVATATVILTPQAVHAETTSTPNTKTVSIHDIQGAGHYSPLNNKKVQDVEGIVTYQYEIRGQHYFHMQTPDSKADNNPNTSEGIIVYTGNKKADVKVGDAIKVTGTVNEYAIDGYDDKTNTDLPVTEINARDDRGGKISIESSNQPLPKPYVIKHVPEAISANDNFKTFDRNRYAIDYWESLEGMRVQTGNVRSVGPQEHGDLFTVPEDVPAETKNGGLLLKQNDANGERIPFKMYDNNKARDFNVVTGDHFKGPIIGYVNYGFQNYKINVDLDDMKKAYQKGQTQPQPTSINPEKQKLTMASYNLENFSNDVKSSSDDKAQKLANGIVKNMKQPDIIGVTEVQDNDGPGNGGPQGDQSYERLIKAIKTAGGPEYKYINIDPEMNKDGGQPGANIRVGFLYNPNRVQFDGKIKPGDANTAVSYQKGNLTRNPGRIDPNNPAFIDSRKPLAAQFKFRGKQVIAIANHWNSKNGDDALFGKNQPVNLGSETQRVEIAKAVSRFVTQVKQDNPKANIVALGDFNDFQWSQPLKTLEGNQMTDLVNSVPQNERYSYVYQGNSQALDHVVVSNNLAPHSKLDMVHVNSDFTDMSGRASDHDPLLVQLDLLHLNKKN
ncbi:endonuclease [Staphylococcus condimenti]|uniref:Endonuclease n=1 Tax=Staphylococcus condimenti TaxID=70255 RepID=A0A4V2DW73_9STAP|nr:endonuclease/exonuclease/phosphatase family protein [Staphylococcus condimenti]RZI00235.1 endonuclease [Staphylococcus condimenti]RZI02170.1 endonuclease [Staphylococcus condimenti]